MSAAIDTAFRDALADRRSLYAVHPELIARLAPDLLLTQDVCEVCAVASSDGALCAIGMETLTLDAHSLDERRLEPEHVVLACCGFDLERTVPHPDVAPDPQLPYHQLVGATNASRRRATLAR